MTHAQDSAKVEAAIGLLTEMIEKSPITLYMGIYTTAEANAAIRTLLAHVAAQAEALAQRPTDAVEREPERPSNHKEGE